jgi:N-acetylneuraminic acid mutarotase
LITVPFLLLVAWQVDILHPCAELEWRECGRLPVGMHNAQAVWLGDKLYVGGGRTVLGFEICDTRLYIHTPTTDTWSHIDTPVYNFALITYHSQLVLVGGREFVGEGRDGPVTNKLWTLTEHDQWRETLPPMTTKRHSASAVEFADNILVAGGEDDKGRSVDIVEVYNGHHWAEAQCLPKPCYEIKSTVLNGHWYLMGGWGQGEEVYYASLDSLVASCRPSEKSLPSVWKRLRDVPHVRSSTAVFGNKLIAVGGQGYPPSSSIHAYSPHTKSWVHVGDMPVGLGSTCTAVLPTGDLMVIGGLDVTLKESYYVHKANLKFNGNRMTCTCMHCLV